MQKIKTNDKSINLLPRFIQFTAVILILSFGSGCASGWRTGATHLNQAPPVISALETFKHDARLAPYFDDAVAILVIPNNFRAGTGFGGAFGTGWLIQGQAIRQRVVHWQFLAGADLGFQLYSQILFFKTEAALDRFLANEIIRLEFGGQVNVSAGIWGVGLTPSYNNDVALFTKIIGGLMFEGSVGLHTYHILAP